MTARETAEAVGRLFETWYSPLVRCASRHLESVDAAEDVVQEAFLSLFSSLREGRRIENPSAWLVCVVRRETIKRYRESQRHGGPFQALSEECEPAGKGPREAWPGAHHDELSRCLATLSGREHEVVLLRAKGMKYREIAGALHVTVGTVKTLMTRAMGKMIKTAGAAPARGKEERSRNDELAG